MDDRFHTEDKNLGAAGDSSASGNKSDMSGFGTRTPGSAPRKFQVHISDFDYDVVPEAEKNNMDTVANSSPKYKAEPDSLKHRKNASGVSKATAKTASAGSKKTSSAEKAKTPMVSAAKNTNQTKKNTSGSASTNKSKPALTSVQKRKKARKRYNFLKNMLISCVCIIFISIITATVSSVALGFLNDVLVISDDSDYTAIVEIPEGATYDDVFQALCDNGLVRQPFLTDFFLRFRHYDQYEYTDSKTGELKVKVIEYEPGKYYLEYSDGVEKMIESIMVKKNYSSDTVRLTFPEGWNIAQIFEKIEKYEVCEADKLYANLDIVAEQYGFINDIKSKDGRYLQAEGYLFPDTYDFFVGESASSVLKKLFNNFSSKWSEDYDEQLKKLGMTKDEVITIASIIQREAKDGSQMKDISAVIHNRLSDPTNFPNIQMNSTTDYITNLKPFNVFSDTYYALYLDEYNTYSNEGLPPGPICSPGSKAIQAALYPSEVNYYFFCHDTSGNVYYAETAQEHAENTSKVLYGDIS